ncbi:MAG: HigA family addiction module antitoxin [Pseudomonadota bacterium]
MTYKISSSEFAPDYQVHPGVFLEEELEIKNLKQSDLAKRTGLTNKTINAIIKGNAPITPDTAVILEAVLGKSAVYWLNLDAAYQVREANKAQLRYLEKDVGLLNDICINDIIKQGWVGKFDDNVQQLKALLSFFGVATVKQLYSVWSKLEVNYRTSQAYKKNHFNIMSWLRRGELLSEEIDCASYNVKAFKAALSECRKLTNYSFCEVKKEIVSNCAEAGVSVVFVPEIKGISTSGAAQWLSKDKALIQLSLRGKQDDKFWFNFYHEAGHILLHGRKEQFIDNEGSSSALGRDIYITPELKLIEAEADDFAANFLIPKKSFFSFVEKNSFTKKDIIKFAKKEDIAPGIVVGQLQKNEYVNWGSKLNSLKKKYEFTK